MIVNHVKIHKLFRDNFSDFDGDNILFSSNETTVATLSELNINYTELDRNNTILVEMEDFPISIFLNEDLYLNEVSIKSEENVLILNLDKKPLSLCEGKTYTNFIEDSLNYFFSNAKAYCEFLDFLKIQEKDTDDPFHFVDYFNTTTRKVVFTSLSDKGRVILKFFKTVKLFDFTVDYRNKLGLFTKCFIEENSHLPKFLKNSLIDYASGFEDDIRIFMVFENLDRVVEKAKINFEIYLNGLSIDKIRKEYDDYKSKYFKEISEILSNLTTKIIGFPILIATTLFAIEKIKESPVFLVFLIIITVVTNIYLVFLLIINFKDLKYIEVISDDDYTTLLENNFFKKFPKEADAFSRIKGRISARIEYLKMICESYYWILGVSNLFTIGLMFSYLKIDNSIIAISFIIGVFIIALCRNNILNNINKITS